jgi:SH3 domain protein
MAWSAARKEQKRLYPIRNAIGLLLFSVLHAEAAILQDGSDKAAAQFRAGQNGHRPVILRTLTSGTPMSLAQSSQDKHRQGQSQDHTRGWITNPVLARNAVSEQNLFQIQTKQDALVAENQRLQHDHLTLRQALTHVQKRLTATRAAQQQLVSTITRLRELIPRRQALEERHQSLLSQLVIVESELELLRVENNARKDDASQRWAMMGFGVLFGGVLAGLLVTRAR